MPSYTAELDSRSRSSFRGMLMNGIIISSLILALCLMVAGSCAYHCLGLARQRRAEQLRAQGYHFIHSLGGYSAWVECQRDLPFTAESLDELISPEPLTRARQIKREWFPSLSRQMLLLLQAHRNMMEYLWEQNLLRLSQGESWRPAYQDGRYQQLRAAQEDLIDEMIGKCRELIGDSVKGWQSTGSDFAFNNDLGVSPQGPANQA